MATTGSGANVPDAIEPLRNLQELLDLISNTPGAILYRDYDRWRALVPERSGLILGVNGSNLPEWIDPSSVL